MNYRNISETEKMIQSGQTVLGIEMGSTRIKAVLINEDNEPIASGGHDWETTLADGVWTYPLEEVWEGIQTSFSKLQEDVREKYGISLGKVKAIGFSGMMHGYMAFDAEDNQLVPFRTWRNNFTEQASKELTELFNYPIPQRWSIAHLYNAILQDEKHVGEVAHLTTLAGYVHWKLTGKKVMGIGEASGMFPINIQSQDFDAARAVQFDAHIADKGYGWKIMELLPNVLNAGDAAGVLTEEGTKLLDPSGTLEVGIPLCPPEGDAGTGMVATNSVAKRTGNVSAGTSVFAMLVLEKELSEVHNEIDLVTTPDGKLVGMAHSNNCSSDLWGSWIGLFAEVIKTVGVDVTMPVLYDQVLETALKADPDCGGLLAYGYITGEHITGFSEGRPIFAREQNCKFSLANFVRAHMFTALCALRTGLNILFEKEGVEVDEIRGHGGFFKTPVVGERIMAAATNTPVSTLATAGEGGAWGIALLANYMTRKDHAETLPKFLDNVFEGSMSEAVLPDPTDVEGFNTFFKRYHDGLAIERAAVESLA